MGKIEKWSVRYALLFPLANLLHWLTHRRIQILGLENIPKNKPVIFAPNHQNALMDAMVVVSTAPGQTVFLARADIFANKFIASLLRFLKIMPVYRIRDGKESLDKNEQIFEKTIRILMKNKRICLFPEAAHVGLRSMLPHKKAIPRIAFLAGEKTNYQLDLQVVPVGISYSHYYNFRRNLVVNYGKPIAVKEYYEILQKEGERKATFMLRDRIFNELEKLILHVKNKNDYEIFDQSFTIFRPKILLKLGLSDSPYHRVVADQYFNKVLHDHLQEYPVQKDDLILLLQENKRLKDKLKLHEKTLQCGRMSWIKIVFHLLLSLIAAPLVVYGVIVNGWIFYLSRYPYRKKIKDKQFWSSISYGISLFAYTIWYIMLFIVIGLVIHNWWMSFGIVLFAIPAGIVAWEIGQLMIRIKNCIRLSKVSSQSDPGYKSLLQVRKDLFDYYYKLIRD